MNENSAQHFSKKVLLLSILFLLVSMAWYMISVFSQSVDIYRTVAPKVVFAGTQDVQIKTLYDTEYHSAVTNQELIAGTYIKTGELEFAEITLSDNVIRLDESTELVLTENNFVEYSAYETDLPRLAFKLNQGSVWINAFDNINIRTQQSAVQFSHAVGIMTYAEPMNRIMMVTGSADLTILNKEGEALATFMVPLYNQVTYTDTQIIPEYSKLRTSKLKKELKLAPIAESLLNDPWIVRNTETDKEYFKEKDLIESQLVYKLKDGYYKFRAYLTFVPQTKRQLAINHTDTVLCYLLGGVNQDEVRQLLADLDELTLNIKSDPLLKKLFTETFFGIGTVESDSPAYALKEYLMEYIFAQDGPQILRTYLSDLRNNLDSFKLEEAKKTAETWIDKWSGKSLVSDIDEFTNQSQIFHRIILSYADRITSDILDAFDKSGEIRMEVSDNSEETRFAITEERLDISSALVVSFRYLAAKQYLKTSYESLEIDELQTQLASKDIFLERAKLLAQRIEYAEEQMHGAAKAIDETEFRDYLQQKTRDKLLSENLKTFLEAGKEEETEIEPPDISEVIRKFADARINVFTEDIASQEDFAFAFEIKNAYLMDRSSDESIISFSAVYDFTTNAVSDVVTKGLSLKGSFELNDLVAILAQNHLGMEPEETIPEDISYYLLMETEGESDEALRAQITAQNLAKQLLLNEFTEAGIQVGMDNIEVLDAVTLTRFNITEAYIENPTDPKNPIELQFDYNSSAKSVSNIFMVEPAQTISGTFPLNQFAQNILEGVIAEQQKQEAEEGLKNLFEDKSLNLEGSDVTVDDVNNIQINNFHLITLPLTVDGTYNLNTKKFVIVSHELYSANNIGIEEYFTGLAYLFIIDFLEKNDISVSENQIEIQYPFNTIRINDYEAGEQIFSFTLDINSNRLKNITLEETGVTVDSMTFNEFSLITAQEPEQEE
jgi:hypothetical protein